MSILYNKIGLKYDPDFLKPKWTPRQTDFTKIIKLETLFLKIKNLKCRRHADFFWKYLQGGLSFNHNKMCDKCNQRISHKHIFYECTKYNQTMNKLFQFITSIQSEASYQPKKSRIKITYKLSWNEDSILKVLSIAKNNEPIFTLTIAALNALWIIFNNLNHNKSTDPRYWCHRELTHSISAEIINIRLNTPSKDLHKALIELQQVWKTNQHWKEVGFFFSPNL